MLLCVVVGCCVLLCVVVVVVVVVEWLYYFKRIIIVRWADLTDFFRRFSSGKGVFLFHIQCKTPLFFGKTVTPQNGLLIFLGKETHSETKIIEIVEDLNKKSHNNNDKPWKSSRILRLNPNFFIFVSFFIPFQTPPTMMLRSRALSLSRT